jgi:hypothetical protein
MGRAVKKAISGYGVRHNYLTIVYAELVPQFRDRSLLDETLAKMRLGVIFLTKFYRGEVLTRTVRNEQ